jgi:prolyl 4-hydroxylase
LSLVVRFSPDLVTWLVAELLGGRSPGAVVDTMIEQKMDAHVARAIVDAVVAARLANRPLPVDSLTIDEGRLGYVYEAPILRGGARIEASDATARVMARSDEPRIAVLANVLRAAECEELIERARPRLETSTIVDPVTGKDVVADHRTSRGMFFRLEEDAFIARLDQRISELMNLPLENGEGLQVLHYAEGARNDPHYDFLQPSSAANRASIARSGQRVSTLIAYLNDVESGGETVFPAIGWAVAPHRGCAVYFEYCNSLGQVDTATVHAGGTVLRGEKWVVTKWMRQRRFVSASDAPSEGMV